jgi:hypothetical protein
MVFQEREVISVVCVLRDIRTRECGAEGCLEVLQWVRQVEPRAKNAVA